MDFARRLIELKRNNMEFKAYKIHL